MNIWVISDDYGGPCSGFKTFEKAMAEFQRLAKISQAEVRETPFGVSRYTFYVKKYDIQYHLYEIEVEE